MGRGPYSHPTTLVTRCTQRSISQGLKNRFMSMDHALHIMGMETLVEEQVKDNAYVVFYAKSYQC